MHRQTFELMVERALKKLPTTFRQRLRNVAVVVELQSPDPDLLGLYEGRPLTERTSQDSFGMPDRITIFQRPHEQMTRNPRQLQKLVDETVWHEVAHYFGLNEQEVLRAERRRARLANSYGKGRS